MSGFFTPLASVDAAASPARKHGIYDPSASRGETDTPTARRNSGSSPVRASAVTSGRFFT